jgi:hypothetical protein
VHTIIETTWVLVSVALGESVIVILPLVWLLQ